MTEFAMYLFARPSFLEGLARVIDFGGTLNEYNYSSDGAQADFLAFLSDIAALRCDIASARERALETCEQT